MKIDKNKKQTVILYLLEKISQKADDISAHVADTFNINRNTVHRYINELLDSNIITRVRRGEYALVTRSYKFHLTRDGGDLDSDTAAFYSCLKEHISNLPQNVQTIWEYTFSEMMNNVIDHSTAEDVYLTITQDYLKTAVTIEDSGIGIFKKIKEHFALPSLDDAICELFKGKLTTDPTNHSGEGIFFSSKIMDDFFIISDKKVFTSNKYDESETADFTNQNKNGTIVYMALSNYSQKETFEIFDLYSNVDGGFTKTTIPLKNIFDTSPVSRSQARRVCNRLDKFGEVILDFDGMGWMGQGFAHQIFVVFQNEHPDIKLIPQNMSPAVKKMYDHVCPGKIKKNIDKSGLL